MGSDFVNMVSQDALHGRGPSAPAGGVTHPGGSGEQVQTSSFMQNNHVDARYKMFDLNNAKEVKELETLMTSACHGKAILREERWSHDKDGLTVVTVSWLDVTPKKKKKATTLSPGDEDMDGTGEVRSVFMPKRR